MIKAFWEWARAIIIALIIGVVLTVFIRPILVKGHSMEPTLGDNNYLLIEQVSYRVTHPVYGDIIVFKSDLSSTDGTERDLIKRVIATEGDRIYINSGNVYVNDRLLDEEYLRGLKTNGTIDLTVPDGCVFVMGDNRGNSLDSRSEDVGFVREDQIRGKAIVRLFPLSRFGVIR